jgi:hypothetical protein
MPVDTLPKLHLLFLPDTTLTGNFEQKAERMAFWPDKDIFIKFDVFYSFLISI